VASTTNWRVILRWDDRKDWGVIYPSASSPAVSDVRGHRAALEDFVRAIREDAEPRCSGTEGRRSLLVVDALYRSARSEAPVVIA
jgi:predicted dehydrogenase